LAAWKDGLWVVVLADLKAGNSAADYSAALWAVSTDVQKAVLKARWRAVSTAASWDGWSVARTADGKAVRWAVWTAVWWVCPRAGSLAVEKAGMWASG
jgi:hypothetical protein